MTVGLSEGPVVTGGTAHYQSFFSCCPLNDRRRAALGLFKISRLSLFFSYLSIACIFILFSFSRAEKFVLTLAPSFPAQCALEM